MQKQLDGLTQANPVAKTCVLHTQLGAAPVTTLGVVPDGVAGAQTDPLGDRAVLLHLLRENLLNLEGLVGRLRTGRGSAADCSWEAGGVRRP